MKTKPTTAAYILETVEAMSAGKAAADIYSDARRVIQHTSGTSLNDWVFGIRSDMGDMFVSFADGAMHYDFGQVRDRCVIFVRPKADTVIDTLMFAITRPGDPNLTPEDVHIEGLTVGAEGTGDGG